MTRKFVCTCDCCGEKIPQVKNIDESTNMIGIVLSRFVVHQSPTMQSTHFPDTASFDLCDECYDILYKFFMEGIASGKTADVLKSLSFKSKLCSESIKDIQNLLN